MRAVYDQRSDSLAIILADAEVEETRNIAPGVEVDYDSSGRVVAIEVLHASDKYAVTDWKRPTRIYHLQKPARWLESAQRP